MDDKLTRVLGDVLGVKAVPDDLNMDTCEVWDSLKHMELVGAIESAFAIELTFEEIVDMRSLPAIRQVLVDRGIGG